jgi:hypothetical protein
MAILGPAALEDAFDRANGAAARRMDLTIRAAETSPSAWKKFADVMKDLAVVLGVTSSLVALPGQVRQAIEGTPSPPHIQVIVEPPQQSTSLPAVLGGAKSDSQGGTSESEKQAVPDAEAK